MPDEKDTVLKVKVRDEIPVELESQFILRLPPTPAAAMRAAVRSGVMNLKDRLSIQIEPDMRHGTVRFDKWYLSSKLIDLPCVMESHKTLDRKTFYKTADICQMMVCREEDDTQKTDEEESPKKKDKKDIKDKKFLWPHGITPSLKNVRKRRFRKTLKKKYVDFPEIEKEVKRLFRMDNEAINIRYDVVNVDEEKSDGRPGLMEVGISGSIVSPGASGMLNSNSQSMDVAEHDIFGEVLSSSEDDVNIVDSGDDEASRLSEGMLETGHGSKSTHFVTEFSKSMLMDSPSALGMSDQSQDQEYTNSEETAAAEQSLNQLVKHESKSDQENAGLMEKLAMLEHEIRIIQARRRAQEQEIASIENQALKQRFQHIIDTLKEEQTEKQRQYDEIVTILHQN